MMLNRKRLWGIDMRAVSILLALISLLVTGCAEPGSGDINLHDIFVQQVSAEKNQTIIQSRERFFTQKFLENIDPEDNKSLSLLTLTEAVEREVSYFQAIHDDRGCLSINGLQTDQTPVVFHLEYRIENGLWRVNYMLLHFPESEQDYVSTALCPDQAEVLLSR
jgi:hypothetical protein